MKKTIKWLMIIVGSLAVLIILTLIIVPFFFDIQKYKPRIEQEMTKAIGRPFTIGGDLKLSLFPWAGLAFSDLHLGNPDGFTEKDFISIKSFDVKVKFLPLLSKDIQVKRFVINGPRIVLEKTKDSRASWQGLGKKESTGTLAEKERKAQEGSQGVMGNLPIKGLTVAEFAIREGELLYIDRASDTRKEVKDLNIELNDVSLEEPFKLLISAIADGKPVSIEGEVGPLGKELGKGTMTVDLAIKAMNILSMKIEGSVTDVVSKPQYDLNLKVENFSPKDLMKGLLTDFNLKTKDPSVLTAMSGHMKIKGTTDNIEISDGTIGLDQSKMTFSAIAKDYAKPNLTLKIQLDKLDADRYLPPAEEKKTEKKAGKHAKTDYGPLRKMVLDVAINIGELTYNGAQIKDIKANLKGQSGIFNLDPFSLNAYEGNMAIVASLDLRGDVPAVTQAKVDIKGIQVRKLMKGMIPDFDLKTKDPEVLKVMSSHMNIKGTTNNIEISDGTIELDQSKMTFSAIAKDLTKPDLTFKMNLDKLDADRYLPPVEEKKAEKKPEEQTKTNYGPLRKMILDGMINIGELTIKGTQIKDIQAKLRGQNGIFNLDPFSLHAYEGNVAAVASLDFKGDVPVTKAKMEVKGVQVRKLISDFMKKDILEGKTNASINISMSGDNAALIKKSLDGNGEVQLRDGAIVGIDLSGMINNLKTAFGMAQSGEKKDRTDFSEFIIPFEINDGVVMTQKTSLVSPVLRVSANGNADLTKETLDFRVGPTFVATLKGQGDTQERSGVTVPVLVTGTFTEPKFSPDLSGMLKKGIEKGIEKLIKGGTGGEDEKTQSTGDTVKGLLKGILGK